MRDGVIERIDRYKDRHNQAVGTVLGLGGGGAKKFARRTRENFFHIILRPT